jgi:hypothetical protein
MERVMTGVYILSTLLSLWYLLYAVVALIHRRSMPRRSVARLSGALLVIALTLSALHAISHNWAETVLWACIGLMWWLNLWLQLPTTE